jgi:hypothetical protein
VRWAEHLPRSFGAVTVEPCSYATAATFVARHYRAIFGEREAAPFSTTERTEAKTRYYEHVSDFFALSAREEPVGVVGCEPSDWSSYYVRTAALVPSFQGQRAIQSFFTDVVFDVLRAAGVERVEIEVAPANFTMLHIAARLRFVATGTLLSERWGALVHYTKFLREDRQRVFTDQFCLTPNRPGHRATPQERNEP